MSNITFQILRLSTFVFNNCSEIIIFTIIFLVRSVIRASWVLVGIMLAQRHRRWPNIILQLGLCIWVVAFLITGDEIVTPLATVAKVPYAYSMMDCYWAIVRHVGSTLKQHLLAIQDAGVEESCVQSVLEWCWVSVVYNWPALNQHWTSSNSGPPLYRNWVGRSTSCTSHSTIHWQVSNGCQPEPAMVVDWINVEDIYFNFSSSLVLSLIISWIFRILAHEEDQYSYLYKTFFVYSTHTT